MEKKGARRVEIAGVDDKCQVTAAFTATPKGEFLPFHGRAPACLPAFFFLVTGVWYTLLTTGRMDNDVYIEQVIVPHMKEKKQKS